MADNQNHTDYLFTFCPKDKNGTPLDGGVNPPENKLKCITDPKDQWTLAAAFKNGIKLYDSNGTLIDSEPPKDDCGVSLSFTAEPDETYRADIVKYGAPDTVLAQCHLTLNNPTECLVPNPEPTDQCSGWNIVRTKGTISIPLYQ